jgi:hypothetical protein
MSARTILNIDTGNRTINPRSGSSVYVDLVSNQQIGGIKRFLNNLITNSDVNFNTTGNIGRIVFKPNEPAGFGGNLIAIYTTDENNGSGWIFDADGFFYYLGTGFVSQKIIFDPTGSINAVSSITGGSLSAGTGTISTTGNISGGSLFVGSGAITGGAGSFTSVNCSSLNANTGTIQTTGTISGGSILCTSLSSGSGTISTTGTISGGSISATGTIQTNTINPYSGTTINVGITSNFNWLKSTGLNRIKFFSSSTTGDIIQILRVDDSTFLSGYHFFNNSGTFGYISGGNTKYQMIDAGVIECNTFSAVSTNTYKNKIEMTNEYANPNIGEIDIISQYIAVVHPSNALSSSANYGFFRTFSDGNVDFDINNISGAVWGTNFSSRLFYTDYTFQCQKSSFVSAYRYQKFMNSATEIGSISMLTGSSIAFTTTSDYRLKQDIIPIQNPLERLMKLQPKNYRFIADAKDECCCECYFDGFLAHEVQDIIPMVVMGVKDDPDNFQQIDYSKLTPICVGAIQDLNKKVDKMQLIIDNQQQLINILITRLDNLEKIE